MTNILRWLLALSLIGTPVWAADMNPDCEANPSSNPPSGSSYSFCNSTTKEWQSMDDAGNVKMLRTLTNANTADVTATSVDTYLTGSSLTIPPQLVRAGSHFRWRFAMSKTGAGTATPIWVVRVGTAGTTADTAILTFTGVAQTANADNGWAEIDVIVRSTGASGVIEGVYTLQHVSTANVQQTGLANQPTDVKQVTSSTFNVSAASLIFGVSCNPGASGVWTFQHVTGEATNL